ncbi:MAG: GAF domain-containing protein [Cytophagales bacterium]|nr:MAG: GAF domain-containing protein [Cytophagales bacterium]TAF60883.1 MAG: GAF domain-containing protein [Cytophagales bacterium]
MLSNANLIYQSSNSLVYSVLNSEFQTPVIVKVFQQENAQKQQIAQFVNEYELLKNLMIEGVRKAYKVSSVDNKPAIWLEYVPGYTVKEYFIDKKQSLDTFFKFALGAADRLLALHQLGFIHKDVTPNNFIYDPQRDFCYIIDFGISSRIELKMSNMGNPENLEGTLAYISPEQTGRMNRPVDYRSDLYSLGVVFYEILVGDLPFQFEDPLEMVHAHLAKQPIPLYEQEPKVPVMLSKIVLKLMAKNAEERYQSAFGLKHDLQICYDDFKERKKISPFELGEQDFSTFFKIPQKLYGREREITQLLDSFRQCCAGHRELLLVSGSAGVGKSALVHEIHKPITEKKGYFVEGKFDQFQRNKPYSAWLKSFNGLINLILTEKTERLIYWEKRITDALGGLGAVLIEVLPTLELVIGQQPALPALGAVETQNRFNYVLKNFVAALASEEHPLVIFIDDWQWADQASTSLLELLLKDSKVNYLMVIAAFRDNEVSEKHLFSLTIATLELAHIMPNYIQIGNLDYENTNLFVADVLLQEVSKAKMLAKVVYEKTQGNPFFLSQFLQSLYAEGLLIFSYDQKCWEADLLRINSLNITDNVVDLMAAKVSKLKPETKELLDIAACVGNSFDLMSLKNMSELDTPELLLRLEPALKEGLVSPISEAYKYAIAMDSSESLAKVLFKFAHDRIQQAIYTLIPKEEKFNKHLNIGRKLLSIYSKEEAEEHVFELLQHFNTALELLVSEDERYQVALLNLLAAKKAKSSVAYALAEEHISQAFKLVNNTQWQHRGDFLRELHLQGMEIAYLNKDIEAMEQLASELMKYTKDLQQKIKIYDVKIAAYFAVGQLPKSVEIGLEALTLLGIKLPSKPSKVHILASLAKTRILLLGKTPDDLMRQPMAEDETAILSAEILANIIPAAYFSTRELYVLLLLKTVRLTVRYGHMPASTFAFCTYGGLFIGLFDNIRYGYTFARLGALLTEKPLLKAFSNRTLVTFSGFVKHWREPIRESISDCKLLSTKCLESGDFEFASNALLVMIYGKWLVGTPLEDFLQEITALRQQVGELGQKRVMQNMDAYKQLTINLSSHTERSTLLIGEAYNENTTEPLDANARHRIYTIKGFLNLLFYEFEAANQNFAIAREDLQSSVSSILYAYYFFLEALGLCAVIKPSDLNGFKKELKLLKSNIKRYEKWAEEAPSNASHRYYLLKAEWARIHRREGEARTYYDDAIAAAKDNGFLSDEAIIYECAGKFYLGLHQHHTARYYLRDALNAYQKWGANAKIAHFNELYGQHLNIFAEKTLRTSSTTIQPSSSSSNVRVTFRQTKRTTTQYLDTQSILKATQALSGEIMLSKLLEKLTLLILENAGAEKVMLIDCRQETRMLQAEGHVGGNVKVLQRQDIEISPRVPINVLNFVNRTKRYLVLNDAVNDPVYGSDPYIKEQNVKSIICLPVVNKGVLNELLYLENNLSVGAFTEDRVETLDALTAQIAISIENALLYENLEEKVRERTTEVVLQKEIIEQKNQDITDSINYAQRIQQNMLPSIAQMQEYIAEIFVFFRPRDIVSGDFYWFVQRQNKIFLAAVDCTGHGVPGAFMSMIGNGLLQQVVFEKQHTEPQIILEKLRKGVRNTLKQSETDNRDGMDIALVVLDKENSLLEFAGAKLSLICIRNKELREIKGDNIIIGGDVKLTLNTSFTKHTVPLFKEEKQAFYLFSDGYQDQFGGPHGKKYMKKRLKQLLLDICEHDMAKQEQVLHQELKSWIGQDQKQIDDVMVVGFRL